MRVSDLKTLFQKKGLIQTHAQPPPASKIATSTFQTVGPQPVEESPQPVPLWRDGPSQFSMRKDKGFLSELNQKLMTHTTKAKASQIVTVSEGIAREELAEEEVYQSRGIRQVQPSEQQGEELNFEQILNEIARTSLESSPLSAVRMGINQRFSIRSQPDSKPDYSEVERSLSEECEQQQLPPRQSSSSKEIIPGEVLVQHKSCKLQTRATSQFYGNLLRDDKIRRIDHIVKSVFSDKLKILVARSEKGDVVLQSEPAAQLQVKTEAKSVAPPRRKIFLTVLQKQGSK